VNIVLTLMCRELTLNTENGVAMDDSAVSHGSPPAPALPPRRYRGEMDLRVVDRLPHSRPAVPPSVRCRDSTNGESTLPHDTYASELRRQARRYQQTQTRGSSFSHPRPRPDWKPPPPPLLPHDPSPQPTVDDSTSSGTSFDSDLLRSRTETVACLSHVRESEAEKSSKGMNELELQKSCTRPSVPVVYTPDADSGLSPWENSTSEVRHITLNNNLQSPRGNNTDSNFSGAHRIVSSSSVTSGYPVVDVVSGYDRYYSIGGDHSTIALSRSFSSVNPDDWSSEVSGSRRLSQPAMQLTRRGLQSTETSPRNVESLAAERSTSSSVSIESEHDSSIDQKTQSTSSNVGLPAGRNHIAVEVKPDSESSSRDLEASSTVEEVAQSLSEVTELSLTELKFFQRRKFPAEVDCARQVEIVAGLLQKMDRDETLVSILVPSSGHRTATDFMTKVLGMVESDHCSYDSLPESLRLRLSARDTRHAAL